MDHVDGFHGELRLLADREDESAGLEARRSSGYSNFQANCWPIALTWSAFGLALPFSDITHGAHDPERDHEDRGIAVQAISRPVLPWIGGPSASSSGGTRHFHTE